ADDDRANQAVATRLADVLDQGVRADRRSVDGVVAALAAGDGAGGVDDRDPRPFVQPDRGRADTRVLVAFEMLALLTGAQLVVHLIFVSDVVDQAGADRLPRQQRAPPEQLR